MSEKRRRKKWNYLRQKFPKRMQMKLVTLFGAIILAFVLLIGQIVIINARDGDRYTRIVLSQQEYRSKEIPYKRGDITDRNGTVLATSKRVYDIIVSASDVYGEGQKTEEEIQKTLQLIKEALWTYFEVDYIKVDGEKIPIEEWIAQNKNMQYRVVVQDVEYETLQNFMEDYPDFFEAGNSAYKVIYTEEDYKRSYPYNTLACDVIGYFSKAEAKGKAGLEAEYDKLLKGVDGVNYGYLDTDSSIENTVKSAVDGMTIVSTIDVALQSIVEKYILAFNEAHKNEVRKGEGSVNTAVIIADPNTGEILAEACYPNYDLNYPGDALELYYTEDEIKDMEMTEQSRQLIELWDNFCVTTRFEPGSTMKPFTEVSGIENGTLTGNETYNCTGSLKVVQNADPIRCHDRSGHGIQTLADGIANSCNVVMMHIVESVGAEEFLRYMNIFGFGQTTGIDLPKESAGLVKSLDDMGPVDLATNSFGQNIEITMTQMIAAYSSLINGGNYYQPHVVKEIRDANGNVVETKEPVLLKKTVSQETSEQLKKYMKQTMTDGTGKNAQVEGYSIGAKTGTAEKGDRKEDNYILSYMGFAPAEDPEVLIYVVIDQVNAKEQDVSSYVTDLAREIMEEAFPYLNITKEEAANPQ